MPRCVARKLGKPVKWTETRSESLLSAHHGRDQIQDIDARRQAATARSPAWTSTCSPTWAPTCGWSRRASRSSARSCSTRSTSSRRYRFALHERVHQQDARPTPTAAPAGRRRRSPSSGSWTSSPPSWAWTRWSCASRTGSSTRSSRSPRSPGLTYDSGNYEAATAQGAWSCSATTGCAREQARAPRARRPGPARHRHLDVHRDVRAGPVAGARLAGVRRGRLGARVDPDAADRQGRGRHRLVARTARATRRRGARSSPTSSACRSRTSRSCTATPRSRRKGMDTYGSRSLAVGGIAVVKAAREGGRQGQDDRRAPARGVRGRPRVRRRAGSRSRAPTRA